MIRMYVTQSIDSRVGWSTYNVWWRHFPRIIRVAISISRTRANHKSACSWKEVQGSGLSGDCAILDLVGALKDRWSKFSIKNGGKRMVAIISTISCLWFSPLWGFYLVKQQSWTQLKTRHYLPQPTGCNAASDLLQVSISWIITKVLYCGDPLTCGMLVGFYYLMQRVNTHN